MATRCIRRSCTQLAPPLSSSAARAFLQLAPKRHLHSSTPPPPPPPLLLDFLVPSVAAAAAARALRHGRAKLQGQGNRPTSISASAYTSASALQARKQISRGFASTSRRQQTTAIVNPRQNDDGSAMLVEITPRASNRLKQIMTKDSNPNLALRIQVESGGCHGFQYLMSLTTLPSTAGPDAARPEASPAQSSPSSGSGSQGKEAQADEEPEDEDTVFAADDGSGAKIVMDGPSLELLQGSKVDFTMELIGSQFKIVDNPKATSSCGCGTSFDIKM